MAINGVFGQRFDLQSAYFRNKLALPSERWDEITREQHDHGFIVAGAMKADLVNDLKSAIQQCIDEGKSIGWFCKNFDEVVEKRGWKGWSGEDSKAGKAWRTEVRGKDYLELSLSRRGRPNRHAVQDCCSAMPQQYQRAYQSGTCRRVTFSVVDDSDVQRVPAR